MKKTASAKTPEKRSPGRPALGDDVRNIEIRVRATGAEAADVSRRAALAGQTLSDYVRAALGLKAR